MDLDQLASEVLGYIKLINVEADGERIYSNYQKVTAYALRLSEIHAQIALEEIRGNASFELKKFRTMVLDPTIERFDRVATYESRKITAKRLELDMER